MSNPDDYTVGWICAISTEYVAAQAFLDEKHEGPAYVSPNDNNDYTLGRIGKHNVVIAVLPDGEYGVSSAGSVARDMLHSFTNIRIGLMVGIGGGVPSPKHDIRLGDIAISSPHNGTGGVLQYDFGEVVQGQGFHLTGFLDQPPTVLRTAVSGLRAQYEGEGHQIDKAINDILEKKRKLRKKYRRPDPSSDRLYQSRVIHPPNNEAPCVAVCGNDESNLVLRCERTEDEDNPMIHYGLIASASRLMKDAWARDMLARENDVLCFEMEAAGLINHFPCLVIRGICDYSDSHKNEEWQGYAAMAAAAYTKDLLHRIPPNRIEAEKRIKDAILGVQEGITKLLCVQHDQENQAILDWFISTDYSTQQSDFIRQRQQGTGEWLLNSKEFRDWINQSERTLFCPGIPGAGKTIITSIVIDHLYEVFQNDANVGIAYIYCSFQRHRDQKPEILLASLLKQLARGLTSVPEDMKNLYTEYNESGNRPSFKDISKLLDSIITNYSRTFIIIDALDEFQVSDGDRTKFISEIFELQMKTGMNIFATSRLIPDIEEEFKKRESIRLEIRARDGDIFEYLDSHMSQLPYFISKSHELKKTIITAILEAVDGMFLLAKLHLESLQDKVSLAQVKQALKKLPRGSGAYDRAYEEAMERIRGQQKGFRDLAGRALSWIICAQKPLTALEIQHALAVSDGSSALDMDNITEVGLIITVCAGLVTVDEHSDIIRLIHYTTQEYFERTCTIWFPNAQTIVAETCVTYLSFDTFDSGPSATDKEFEDRLSSNVLFYYAARNWGHHARTSSIDGTKLILDFLESENKISACTQAMKTASHLPTHGTNFPRQVKGVHLAAYFGLRETMMLLLEKQQDPDSKNSYNQTPLFWAAMNGHGTVVKLLLDKGANFELKDIYGWTPLSWAMNRGHEAVVKPLLDKGAIFDSKDMYGWRPLLWAANQGHTAVAKLLLNNGADTGPEYNDGWAPLLLAIWNRHEALVKLLLDEGADPNCKSMWFKPLSWAILLRYEAIVKLLLDKGASIDSCGQNYNDLLLASEQGLEAVVKLLLVNGANHELKDGPYGWTPLLWAASNGYNAVVKLLLDKGADYEFKDKSGRTALSLATKNQVAMSFCGRLMTLKWIESQECLHQMRSHMILDVAAFGYNQSIIDDLERSADNLHEYRKKDVLQQSRLLRNSREAAVKLLLDSGAEIESKDNFGRTPLSWAAQERANVDDGALLMFPGSSRQTLLLRAATQRAGIAKLLLDYGADLESRDYSGRTPLSWAVEGDPKVVKLLLDNGADIESKDNSGRTPLSWAVERNTEMVGLLLNNGADIESKDDSGRTPLSWAMEKGSKAVKLLLDNGADSESKDNSDRMPLSWGETTAEDAETSQPRKKRHECQL